ncbi:MAG: decaprenyl-phosphate phosphoribosyltransferase [Propionibacteriaceae bacterium]|nr:decaprenyl-phosphate phosphoribosyltransferase [Propionibacteriaceae bacterium]
MTDSAVAVPEQPPHRLPALVRLVRPGQWLKNSFVVAAPLAAGRLFEDPIWWRTLVAALAFALVAAAVYVLNDLRDQDDDRRHPVKRHRPIASGEVAPRAAGALLAVTAAAGLGLAVWLSWGLAAIVAVYAAFQVAYSLGLKHLPIIDLALVAAGFLLRAVAGGVATGIPLTHWFLLVAGFGSLFIVAGKRYSELVALGPEAGTRRSLARYTVSFLRTTWSMAATLVVASYSLWAFDQGDGNWLGLPWAALSIAPFTLAILAYARVVDSAQAEKPERALARDPVFLVMGALWFACAALAIFTR